MTVSRSFFIMKRTVTFIARETPYNAHAMNVLLACLDKFVPRNFCLLRYGHCAEDILAHAQQAELAGHIPVTAWSFHSNEVQRVRNEIEHLRHRLNGSSTVFIAGGAHVTARPENALDMGFDTVFCGEGEQLIIDYISELIRNSEMPDQSTIRVSDPHDKINLDRYPALPERIPKLNSIEITRGCIYACRFCQTSYIFGASFRHRSVESITTSAQILVERGGHFLRMTTPSALSYGSPDKEPRPDQVERLLKSLRQILGPGRKLYFGAFPSEIRPEHVSRGTLQILRRYVDNDNIILGIQSGSEKILNACSRTCDPDMAVRAVEMSLDSGFRVNADFIFGLPDEDRHDKLLTISLIKRLAGMGAKIHGHWFMPLPGTPFEFEKPSDPDPELISELDALTAQGKLYGQWKSQIK